MPHLYINKSTCNFNSEHCNKFKCFPTSFVWYRHRNVDRLLENIVIYLKALKNTKVEYFYATNFQNL